MKTYHLSFSKAEEWLSYIEQDIKEKYKISDPIFLLNEKIKKKQDVINWINKTILSSNLFADRWIKYKQKSVNKFELKSFFPDPSKDICIKIILNYFKEAKIFFSSLNSSFPISYKIGKTIYNQKEAEKQMLYIMNLGSTDFSGFGKPIPEINLNKNRIIHKVEGQEAEMFLCVEENLVEFEYKD